MKTVTQLSKAFALSVPHERAIAIRDDVAFFQTVRAALAKTMPGTTKPQEDLDAAVRQIVSRAVATNQVIDIFSAAGLKAPDISILSDEFLAEVKDLPQRNLAFEALKKLLTDEIKTRSRKNLLQSRLFSEMLEKSIRKYQNRSIETAAIIQELIDLAKDLREAAKRGEKLGFTDEELAFYDALEVNDSVVKVLGDETLRIIAQELGETVHKNTTIDWTVKESVKAKLRTMVKRILRKHGYPPDKQEKATQTVLEQAELLCADWAARQDSPSEREANLPGEGTRRRTEPMDNPEIACVQDNLGAVYSLRENNALDGGVREWQQARDGRTSRSKEPYWRGRRSG